MTRVIIAQLPVSNNIAELPGLDPVWDSADVAASTAGPANQQAVTTWKIYDSWIEQCKSER